MDTRGDPEGLRQSHYHAGVMVPAAAGALIVLEGCEGAGKSTQAARLARHLGTQGIPHLALREPGGTAMGEQVRRLLLDPASELVPAAEALLFMASRSELVQRVVRPALARGRLVLLDRFFLSTYAYQIFGRGLPEQEVRSANMLATGGLVPDLTLLLSIGAQEGLERASRRGGSDRMERSGDAFHQRVSEAFRQFASAEWQRTHAECGPIVRIDASRDEEAVFRTLLSVIGERWPVVLAGTHAR